MKMKTQISLKLILIGLLSQIDFSHSRAVNISNTWTLPQAGFNVFYRYFRDKISWFEADAVCQFHHANLVTVENIEQFDATRLFLKELDIPDFVWIGLMRPSNTDQFSWTNSKPLPVSEGYWAEPWPVSDTPLCAVIDPSRDYRWHTLRCGGPETAAFLCEMEIPEWAIHCTENPDVTVQYISDSGAVQLSRRCNDTLKEISCQTKANQMDMYNALKCPEEEILSTTQSAEEITVETSKLDTQVTASTTLKADEEVQPKVIIKNPQKMMEDIFDSIDMNVEVDSNRLDDSDSQKMDLDLMVGDQPIPDDDDESDKKILLKLPDKKEVFRKKSEKMKEKLKVKDDDMMMGDAPADDFHSTTESSELPTSTIISTTDRQRRDANLIAEMTTSINDMSASTTNDASTTEELSTFSTELPQPSSTEQITTPATEEPTTKIFVQGHPLHMSQAIFKEPIQPDGLHERINFSDSDVFIPPMLLVKAKFTTTTSTGTEHSTASDIIVTSSSNPSTEQNTIVDVTDIVDESSTTVDMTTTKAENNEISVNETAHAMQVENTITTVESSEKPIMVGKRTDPRLGLKEAVPTTTTTTSTVATTEQITTIISSEIPSSTTESEELTSTTDESSISSSSTFEITAESSPSSTIIDESESSSVSELATTTLQSSGSPEKLVDLSTTTIISSAAIKVSELPAQTTTTTMRNDINAYHHQSDVAEFHPLAKDEEADDSTEDHETRHVDNKFSNADDEFQPYKPNRHRTLSKHDQHHGPGFTLGKILG